MKGAGFVLSCCLGDVINPSGLLGTKKYMTLIALVIERS